ncbi:MAG: DUF2796 domain-containing protein [Candidatus Margulisiibacteriota bacterium]
MKKFILAAIILCLTTLTHANTPHIHGEATASMIIKNNKVTIELSIPSESIVGFEHSPTTDDEIKQIKAATKQLETHSLFNFYEVSGILKKQTKLQPIETSINVHSPVKKQVNKHDDHHHHDHDHQIESKQESHSEFDIQLSYSFNETSKIAEMKSHLLELYPLLEKVIVIVVTDTSQNEFILTKNQPTIEINTNE